MNARGAQPKPERWHILLTPPLLVVLVLFMSAAAIIPTPTIGPIPVDRDQPTRAGRLLAFVRKLIDYGKELAATLQQRSTTTDLAATARCFGTADIAHILARLMCGLHRARALEDKIVRSAARLDADPRSPAAQPLRQPRAAQPPVRRIRQAALHLNLAPLPTPEQIAAKVRHQRIGAVIADICRDLGIMPSHPLWRELRAIIMEYQGGYARLVIEIVKRPWLVLPPAWPTVARAEPLATACATGPP
jgi:hypothetical protein